MKRIRFSEEQIIAMLKEQEAGMATADVAAAMGSVQRPHTSTKLGRGVGSAAVARA